MEKIKIELRKISKTVAKIEAVILMNRKPESGKDTKVLIQKNWK